MDLKKYIDSGILEFYALDLLNEEEEEAVKGNMVLFPKVKTELTEIENALFAYCMAYARKAPKKTKEQIMIDINRLKK